MLRRFVFIWVLLAGSLVNATENTETNKKIQYFSESGFGAEGEQGAFSLENADTPLGTCLWDVILFNQSFTEKLKTAYEQDQTLGKFIFSVDQETGDCHLKQVE